ncbi:ferredoxin--NADP reductase [Nanoarchaeota archaeon]
MNAKLIWKKEINPETAVLRFSPEYKVDFYPGQFFNICVIKDEEIMARPYSITSTPEDEYMEFYVKAHKEGTVAKHILALKINESAGILGPHGNFIKKESDNDVVFIAAGSGIAPLMSMARHLVKQDSFSNITFLHAASHVEELAFFDELKQMDNASNFTYISTISKPNENPEWDGNTGRVDTLLRHCKNNDAEAYICGPPPMIIKVKRDLLNEGFDKKKIFTEGYY